MKVAITAKFIAIAFALSSTVLALPVTPAGQANNEVGVEQSASRVASWKIKAGPRKALGEDYSLTFHKINPLNSLFFPSSHNQYVTSFHFQSVDPLKLLLHLTESTKTFLNLCMSFWIRLKTPEPS